MKTIKKGMKMKSNLRLLPLLALAGLLIFTGCEKEDESMDQTTEKNVVEVASDAGQFTILLEAAQKAGLAEFLGSENNITVFAPTDNAFNALFSKLGVSGLNEIDGTTLANILKYHVVDGRVYSDNLTTGVVSSLNQESPDKKPLSIFVTKGAEVNVNDAKVTLSDISASNGLIHVIDKVLLPPTVVDIATFSSDFSSLVAAVVKSDLVSTLSGEGPFTVFAPTNNAFSVLFSSLGISGLDEIDTQVLSSILTYHVVGGNVLSSELSNGSIATVSGEDIEVTLGSEVVINGTVKVVVTDIQGTNGVIHVIDAVLMPVSMKSNTIADIAVANSDFSILVQALYKAGLVDAVADKNANLTVFAPTNSAFQELLSDLGASSLDDIPVGDLTNILLYHVLGTKVNSSGLSTGYFPTLATSNSNNISMYINVNDGVFINKNTKVTTADIEADNGVIHVVDHVILPPSVVNIALDNDNFTILVQAVVKAGIVETLSGSGPFTVFAPTNNAFETLFTELGINGIEDLTAEQLIPILAFHVVSGNVLSTDLSAGSVTTLNEGNSLTVDLSNGVKINDSNVIAADIQAANGVVHVIDKVLIP